MGRTDTTGRALPSVRILGAEVFPPSVILEKSLPSLGEFIKAVLDGSADGAKLSEAIGYVSEFTRIKPEQLETLDLEDFFKIIVQIVEFMTAIKQDKRFMLPNIPGSGDGGYQYPRCTEWEKIVADYAGISIPAVMRMNYIDFLICRKDAFIYLLSQSKEGRDKLEQAYCYEQTEPDRAALRAEFGGGKRIG